MTSTRAYCHICHYPLKTCLCAFVTPVSSNHQIIILQHPSEVAQAKGTARLVDLAMSQARIVVGETAEDFAALVAELFPLYPNESHNKAEARPCAKPCYLVYPQASSQNVETLGARRAGEVIPPSTLLFLDGSWKKAWKLLQLNPWLAQLPSLTFSEAGPTEYQIRKAPRKDSLSTIESVAYCLDHLDNTDTTGLIRLFKAMIDGQWRFMSKDVQGRYRS
ncbi:MAG: DTW domain-containing protein YfiP [Phenylobacterium sp.]|jgi:DTW domain-containing protein YfiP